jgi:Fe-S oxidoreductase
LAIRATYHDPCHLGRHCDYYEPPRALIAKLEGVEFVEMPRTRSGAWCCGSGGGVKSAFGDLATEIATDRLKEAKEVGAEYLLSCCPFCKHNFLDAKRAMGSDLEIYDLIELVSQAT